MVRGRQEYKSHFGVKPFKVQLKDSCHCCSSRRTVAVNNPLKVVITNLKRI